MVWDKGTWTPEEPDVADALRRGNLKFALHGKKLRGSWALVRTKNYGGSRKNAWLLIKHRDKFASKKDITEEKPYSALTGRSLADIASDGGGNVEKAASGDPLD
jgi:bifunctional non-homologous end joining protein LigD